MEGLIALIGPLTQAGLQVAQMIANEKAVGEQTDPAVIRQALVDITNANQAMFTALMAKLEIASQQS